MNGENSDKNLDGIELFINKINLNDYFLFIRK